MTQEAAMREEMMGDVRHGGYGHVCWEGCDVWTSAPPTAPVAAVDFVNRWTSKQGHAMTAGEALDKWVICWADVGECGLSSVAIDDLHVLVTRLIAEEREACAQIADVGVVPGDGLRDFAKASSVIASLIRARATR